jgi:hypothetical protein
LRGDISVPKRMILASNPCGVGHVWLYRKHVLSCTAWHPYKTDDGQVWVTAPSLFTENPFIDSEQYRRDLEAACSFDGELLKAFRDGRWDVTRGGSYFGGCLNQERVMFPGWKLKKGQTWRGYLTAEVTPCGNGIVLAPPDLEKPRFWIAMDWGYSAPCIVVLMMSSPGMSIDGKWFPRGSVLVLDEVSTARPGQPHVGGELSVDDVSVRIKDMCRRYGVRAMGVCDDACGIRNDKGISIVDEFARCGVYFQVCHKGSRVAGWTHMREMLNNASLERIDRAGLFISDRCSYTWETLPFLARSMRNPEDLEGVADHAADCIRYGLLRKSNPMPQREF